MDVKMNFPGTGAGQKGLHKAAPPQAVDDAVQEQFRQALDGPTPPSVTRDSAVGEKAGREGGSLGDAILSGLDRMSTEFQTAWSHRQDVIAAGYGDMSPVELLKFQAQVQTSNTVIDLLAKGVSKTVQGVEQLTKIQ